MFVPVTSRGLSAVSDYSNLVPGTDPGAAAADPALSTVTVTQNPDVVQNLNVLAALNSLLPVSTDGGYLQPGAAPTSSSAINPMWLFAAVAGVAALVMIGGRRR